MPWLRGLDAFAGAIKSGGTLRRAAKMVIMDVDHPDIEDFVAWKPREEDKVAAMHVGMACLRKHATAMLEAFGKPEFAKAASAARKDGIPGGFIARITELAKQGFTSVEIQPIGRGAMSAFSGSCESPWFLRRGS